MKNQVPKRRRLTLPALLCCLPAAVSASPISASTTAATVHEAVAQPEVPVSGRVLDENGQGMPGVTVLEKGTSNGVTTNAEGRFTLNVASSSSTLVFSFVGYTSREVAVGNQTTIDVSLAPDAKALNEVVVVGYLTQERQNVTGSVASVSAEDVRRAPVASVGEAIQGRVPGVTVTNSGQPGQAPNINIRGLGTIASGSGPLYVIDGLWVQGQNGQRDFNPADVESVQVLKDAAALAPYGASGANGVIIITTKKGRSGPPVVSFNANGGVQNIIKRLDLANAEQWAAINNQAYDNTGQARQPFAANLPGIDTDWQDEFFKRGSVQDYNLGFSGGGPNSTYNVTGGYFRQNGTVVGPKFDRYSFRVNTSFNRGRLSIGENLLLTRSNQTRLNFAPLTGSPFINLPQLLPVPPVRDPSTPGGYGIGNDNASTFATNPIALQDLYNDTGVSNRVQGNVYAEVSIWDFLRYRLNLATEYNSFRDQQRRQFGVWRLNDPVTPSNYGETQGTDLFGMVENTLTLDKSFGQHNLTVVAGYSQQRFERDITRGVNFEYGRGPIYYWALDAGSQTPQVIGSSYVWAKQSLFGQVTYDYDQRYLVTAAFRRDGSSRFEPDNRWGNFGAASVGWRVSKEQFFENVGAISDLKLRASYGRLGNDFLGGPYGGSYQTQFLINTNVNYGLGGGTAQNGAISTNFASTGIRWEDRRTTNVGFDAGFLEDKLTFSADYYVSQTFNALINPNLPLALGNAGSNPFRNLGKLENKGFEFVLGYNNTSNKFRYGATANLTTIKNTVLELGTAAGSSDGSSNFFNGGPQNITRTEEGYEVGSFYLFQFDGIYQTGENIPNGLQPGDVRYRDLNGDGEINERDRAHVGRVFPKFQYGFNLSLGYGGFDLTAFLQGVQGNDVFNVSKTWYEQTANNSNYLADFRPWTPDNPSNTTPRALRSGGNAGDRPGYNDRFNSTRWLEDGSYLRMKNLQLGFTVPKPLLERTKYVSSLRVYATAQNLFTITDYSGYDPETVGSSVGYNANTATSGSFNTLANNLGRGVDDGAYPNLRSFTIGIQAGF